MLRVEVNRDTPCKGCPGNAQILKTRKEEVVHHLILAGLRLNEFRMCIDMLDQTISVFAHAEEVGFLGGRGDFTAALRTFAVHELRFRVEGLALLAVHTLVLALVDVALLIHLLEDFLDLLLMIFVRCADELVVGCVHQIPDPADFTGGLVDEFLRCETRIVSAGLDLLAMLVCSCLEENIIALLPLESCDRVSKNNLICISDMRLA